MIERDVVRTAAAVIVGLACGARALAEDLRRPVAWAAGDTVTETESADDGAASRVTAVVRRCTAASKDGRAEKAVLHLRRWCVREGTSEDRSLEGALLEVRADGWTLLRTAAEPTAAARAWLASGAVVLASAGERAAAEVLPASPVAAGDAWKASVRARGEVPVVCKLVPAPEDAAAGTVQIAFEGASGSETTVTGLVRGVPGAWHRTAVATTTAVTAGVTRTRELVCDPGGDVPPGTPGSWLTESAVAKAARGDADGALADFATAIDVEPLHAAAWRERGRLRAAKGDLRGAAEDLTRAIETDPRDAAAWSGRAAARVALGALDDALADCEAALALDADSAEALYHRGVVRAARKDADGALADFGRAIDLAPGNADALWRRGFLRQQRSDFAGAIADYTRVLEIRPDHAGATANRAGARERSGDLAGAVADCVRVCELEPANAAARFNLGRTRAAAGEFEAAMADLTKAIEMNPGHAPSYNTRGNCRNEEGDWEGAVADWTKALELDPKHPQARFSIARARFQPGLPVPPVVEDLRASIAASANSDYARLWLWLARTRQGEEKDATAELAAHLAARKSPAGDWYPILASMLTGDEIDDNVLAESMTPDPTTSAQRLCEAAFFAGMRRWIVGDVERAVELLDRSILTDVRTYVEWQEAHRWRPALMLGATTRAVRPAPTGTAVTRLGVVKIVRPDPKGPAARAGLLDGDAVTRIAGAPAKPGQLEQILRTAPPGTKVKLEVVRGTKKVAAEVVLGVAGK